MNGETLFWIGLGGLAYEYIGYPILLALISPLLRRRYHVGSHMPTVSMILAAHNEAAVIEQKIENTLALDYPSDRLQLIVVSDASDDGTDAIVKKYCDRGIVLLRQEQRAGKSTALNRGMQAATGEIFVFTDANSMFARESLRHLVAPFSNARIGAVSGVLQYTTDVARSGEGLYWRYEQVVKSLESNMGRLLGANGAIYAIRRELYPQLHPMDVDDFRVPYEAVLKGRAVVMAPEASAIEMAALSVGSEMARKVRIMSTAIPMFLSLLPRTFADGRPLVAWQLISHKILREFQAIFFLAMLAGGIWDVFSGSLLGWWLLMVQMIGYGIGGAGWLLPRLRRSRLVQAAVYVTMIAITSVWALARWISGRNRATWQRTERYKA